MSEQKRPKVNVVHVVAFDQPMMIGSMDLRVFVTSPEEPGFRCELGLGLCQCPIVVPDGHCIVIRKRGGLPALFVEKISEAKP